MLSHTGTAQSKQAPRGCGQNKRSRNSTGRDAGRGQAEHATAKAKRLGPTRTSIARWSNQLIQRVDGALRGKQTGNQPRSMTSEQSQRQPVLAPQIAVGGTGLAHILGGRRKK